MPLRNLAAEAALSQEYLKSILHYDPLTGAFTWLVKTAWHVVIGAPAGSPHKDGYWHIGIKGRRVLAHRLAVLYMTGKWPDDQVDHKDLDRRNNQWENLRLATNMQNHQNSKLRSTNKSGHTGVWWDKSHGKWRSSIRAYGSVTRLGDFDSKEGAIKAYTEAKARLHTFQPTVPVAA